LLWGIIACGGLITATCYYWWGKVRVKTGNLSKYGVLRNIIEKEITG